jgi:hypothetical protein
VLRCRLLSWRRRRGSHPAQRSVGLRGLIAPASCLARRLRAPLVLAGAALLIVVGCGNAARTARHATRLDASTGETIAGVVFVPVAAAVRKECENTANTVGYAIPCPTILPAGLAPTPPVDGCGWAIVAPSAEPPCGVPTWRGWMVGSSQIGDGASSDFQHLILQAAPRIVRDPAQAIDGPGMLLAPIVQ